MKRRRFLESAALGGVVWAGNKATSAAEQTNPRVHPTGDETIKVALVGCGFRGTGAVAQALLTKGPVKLWAVADLFSDRVEASLKSLEKGLEAEYDRDPTASLGVHIDVPPERRFVGFDAYKQAIDSGVDMVILATHQHFRPIHFAYAVKQGKHVFMEKPMGVDAPGVRLVKQVGEEARKKNLKVGVGLYMRHKLSVQEVMRRVRDGAVGPVELMCCYFNMSYLRDTPPRPDDMNEMTYQLRNPYHFQWLSGDYVIDALVHYFDLCLWLHGSHPISAQGQGGRQTYLPTQQGDAFDHQAIEFTFEDGAKLFAQTRQISGCWNQSTAQAYGHLGRADLFRGWVEGPNPWRHRGPIPNPYQVEHDVLFDAIRNDKPLNDVDHATRATLVGIMGRMAAYSGQQISWDQVLNCNVSLAPERYAFDATPPVLPDKNGRYPIPIPGITKPY